MLFIMLTTYFNKTIITSETNNVNNTFDVICPNPIMSTASPIISGFLISQYIIKIDNIINVDYSVLGFIDPDICVNVIENEKIEEIYNYL